MSQSPSLRGSGRFVVTTPRAPAPVAGMSQSPSLRGSGRFGRAPGRGARRLGVSIPFIAGQWSLPAPGAGMGGQGHGLNPLHCGAVVASQGGRGLPAVWQGVSIPFIAGQWSLLGKPPAAGRGGKEETSLNPLHCGAVVASGNKMIIVGLSVRVSIPFIAGQWSLRCGDRDGGRDRADVSIPFIAGQWSLRTRSSIRPRPCRVSIPFIAGQWSLRGRGTGRGRGAGACLNPLHCGAVVASALVRALQRALPARFNPLHCGAVVASTPNKRKGGESWQISIPFIAGQWSLRFCGGCNRPLFILFQSPSLRGSGRF